MSYYCRVERDSISPAGNRLTTFIITFPRIVLAEMVTHRRNYDTWSEDVVVCERTATTDVSKNSASSRAIPIQKMVDQVMADAYVPEPWTTANKGMQGLPSTPAQDDRFTGIWLRARNQMVANALELHEAGASKEFANRLLEPFCWVTQVVTSSCWDNFFALRCHQKAHPAFRRIAQMMYLHRRRSTPRLLKPGQWHLPFVQPEEQQNFVWEPDVARAHVVDGEVCPLEIPDLIKFSAARCAWVSYCNHDRDGTPEKMLTTYQRLMEEIPRHASPLEHQATPSPYLHEDHPLGWDSNLRGWIQARKLIPHEEIREYRPTDEEIASWDVPDNLKS